MPQHSTALPSASLPAKASARPHDRLLPGLIKARWWALGALLLLLAIAPGLLDLPLPQEPMLAILAAVGLWNGLMHWQLHRSAGAPDATGCLLQLCIDLLAFASQGFGAFAQRFARLDALQGLTVQLSDGTRGTACGVNDDGALQVLTDQGMQTVTSAEVSVRPC